MRRPPPIIFAALLAAVAVACTGAPESRPGQPVQERRGAVPAVPVGEPGIRGTITRLTPGLTGAPSFLLIEEIPGTLDSGGQKAQLQVTAETRLYRRGGEGLAAITFADLSTGQRVEAWFEGPVMESYPVQARAGTLIVQ